MEIKLLESHEIDSLTKVFTNPSFEENLLRFEAQQKGSAAYIIAKQEGVITGKLYLKYRGSNDKEVSDVVSDCPDMKNLEIVELEQGKGVGTAMIYYAEKMCQENGFKKVGLGVEFDNQRARKLYERLGYIEAIFPFIISFPWKNKDGEIIQLNEEVVYLVKELV